MREILFKAKRKDNGEWLVGNLDKIVYEHPNKTIEEYYINETHFGFQDDDGFDPCYQCGFNESVDENTICEAVRGLKDKNGKQVFEHDIVKFSHPAYDEDIVGEVVYSTDEWGFEIRTKEDECVSGYASEFYEVIGNKFDLHNNQISMWEE